MCLSLKPGIEGAALAIRDKIGAISTMLMEDSSRSVLRTAPGAPKLLRQNAGTIPARRRGMKWRRRIRRAFIILTLYGIGLLEAYYLPRYGIEWMLAALGGTALLAGFWMRTHWDI